MRSIKLHFSLEEILVAKVLSPTRGYPPGAAYAPAIPPVAPLDTDPITKRMAIAYKKNRKNA